ncbi:hypothetical protein I4F81_006058 [Pyropia yezoensis]|uniref:Uncharacterized protein n=1 Tax=Pyropia yezoensis TaxID=2788 RepID=A0ACC3C0W5_PYRYE|nr:hypothetical protein I4F81_006058 [Neopyropia yezoensis]
MVVDRNGGAFRRGAAWPPDAAVVDDGRPTDRHPRAGGVPALLPALPRRQPHPTRPRRSPPTGPPVSAGTARGGG